MLFSEIYGSYFETVATVLARAAQGGLTGSELTAIVQETAFGESVLTIPAALKDGRWKLLTSELETPLRHAPDMPLSMLQKQWLKALLSDPRMRLFAPSEAGLEEVEPLYDADDFVYFDRYGDGDPYEDERYIRHFRTILTAMRERRKLRVRFHGHRKTRHSYVCVPYRLEYSSKDDKFRLLTEWKGSMLTVNLARIRSVGLLEHYSEDEYSPPDYREKSLVMELVDERNALERAMLHFSDLEKETERLAGDRYRITLWYKQGDEAEILIRILSFGPLLKVLSPGSMVRQIRQRLERQRRWQPDEK